MFQLNRREITVPHEDHQAIIAQLDVRKPIINSFNLQNRLINYTVLIRLITLVNISGRKTWAYEDENEIGRRNRKVTVCPRGDWIVKKPTEKGKEDFRKCVMSNI